MTVKEEYFKLKDRWMNSKGEEREKVNNDMQAFFDALTPEERLMIEEAVNEDFARIHQDVTESHRLSEQINMRKQMESVLPFISISEFSKHYFGKSASWMHQRINGNSVHGKPASFTQDELKTLADSLSDLSNRLSAISSIIHRSM